MSDRFNNIYRIPSARAVWHDYDGGFYHVTICTANRDRYFGRITVGENGNVMELSPIGEYAVEQFRKVQQYYPYAEIPCFIVMPDHIHAIVYLSGRDAIHRVSNPNDNACTDAIHRVSNRDMTINARDAMNRVSCYEGRDNRLGQPHVARKFRRGYTRSKGKDYKIRSRKRHSFCMAIPFLRPHYPQSGGIERHSEIYRR